VYDMYYWDEPDLAAGRGASRRGPVRAGGGAGGARRAGVARRVRGTGSTGAAGPAARAVQVALDRRDNGGDAGAPHDQ
jgi:hypothetical protein